MERSPFSEFSVPLENRLIFYLRHKSILTEVATAGSSSRSIFTHPKKYSLHLDHSLLSLSYLKSKTSLYLIFILEEKCRKEKSNRENVNENLNECKDRYFTALKQIALILKKQFLYKNNLLLNKKSHSNEKFVNIYFIMNKYTFLEDKDIFIFN